LGGWSALEMSNTFFGEYSQKNCDLFVNMVNT